MEDPKTQNARLAGSGPLQVVVLEALLPVVETPSSPSQTTLHSADYNFLDARVNVARLAHVHLPNHDTNLRREVEDTEADSENF
ncbi:unnamed protein product [Agarophyton chilense]